eukprot:7983576-Pyramimonas_sp.AAC.1
MDPRDAEYRPFMGPSFRLGGQLTQPVVPQRAPVIEVDDSADAVQPSRISSEDAEKLESMQKVAASWLEIIPAHPYSEAILASIEKLVVDLTTILSTVDANVEPQGIEAAVQ